jgi:hypothetical protein
MPGRGTCRLGPADTPTCLVASAATLTPSLGSTIRICAGCRSSTTESLAISDDIDPTVPDSRSTRLVPPRAEFAVNKIP